MFSGKRLPVPPAALGSFCCGGESLGGEGVVQAAAADLEEAGVAVLAVVSWPFLRAGMISSSTSSATSPSCLGTRSGNGSVGGGSTAIETYNKFLSTQLKG